MSDAVTSAETAGRPGLVSVLIPCWNSSASIERALASVLEEREVELEAIVVDDGSTDATADLVQAVADRDARVRLVRLPSNEGVSNARNSGLEIARGEWLTLLDADDRFLPGGLATLFTAARETGALAVIGQQVWADGVRTWVSPYYDIPDIRVPGRKSLVRNPGLLYFASPHAKLFHRSCTDGLRFAGRVLGDQPWTIRALLRAGDRIEVLGETVYEWTRPGGRDVPSITASTRSSAGRVIAAVAVAQEALASVRGELERVVPDPAARHVVAARYTERLLRSDLGVYLSAALGRHDPATGDLLTAIERFLSTVPTELLAGSDALATEILRPPLLRWFQLPADARAAYVALFGAAIRVDPEAPRRGRTRSVRFALQLAGRRPGPIARMAASGVLVAARVVTGLRRRIGRPTS